MLSAALSSPGAFFRPTPNCSGNGRAVLCVFERARNRQTGGLETEQRWWLYLIVGHAEHRDGLLTEFAFEAFDLLRTLFLFARRSADAPGALVVLLVFHHTPGVCFCWSASGQVVVSWLSRVPRVQDFS